jgi:hypothetical protein
MSSEGSVTHWIGQLQAGNAAAQPLGDRFFRQLVYPTRKKRYGAARRAAVERKLQRIRGLWSAENPP